LRLVGINGMYFQLYFSHGYFAAFTASVSLGSTSKASPTIP
jgi:hypothetical protein